MTHVCRYWRESIGYNPENWKSIGIGWEGLVPLCLERARAVPLVVDIAVPDIKEDQTFLNILLPHVPRIGTLRLTGCTSTETVAEDLPGFFASPILNLTSLELQQTEEPTQLFPSDDSPVPPLFLDVSKLKSLSLTRTPIYPALFTIPSLVELKLIGYTTPFDFGTFLGLLDASPGLECVVLDIQFLVGSVDKALTRKIPLPRLQHLSIICSNPADSKGLLSCIPLPRGTNVEVVFTEMNQSHLIASFLPSPPTSIQELLTPITTIKTQMEPRELRAFGNGSTFTFRSPQLLRDPSTDLVLFSGAAVREYHVTPSPFRYSHAGLSKRLGLLPALEILAFYKNVFTPGLFSVLGNEPVFCPALKTIAFFDCGLDSDLLKELGEAIAKRRASTAVWLYRVVIVISTGTPPDLTSIQQLRELVPCVEVRVDDKLPDLS